MIRMNHMPARAHQQAGFIILNLSFLLCVPDVPGDSVTFAAQGLEPAAEEIYVPGKPVTNESVEAGLLTRRKTLRLSPAFRNNDAPTHLNLAGMLSQQGDPTGAIEEFQAGIRLNPASAEAYRGLREC
jgi:hypothetical protein